MNTANLDRELITPTGILPMDGNCNAVYQFVVKLTDNPGGVDDDRLSTYTNVSVCIVLSCCNCCTLLGDYSRS